MGYSQSGRQHFNPTGGQLRLFLIGHPLPEEAGFNTGQATYTG